MQTSQTASHNKIQKTTFTSKLNYNDFHQKQTSPDLQEQPFIFSTMLNKKQSNPQIQNQIQTNKKQLCLSINRDKSEIHLSPKNQAEYQADKRMSIENKTNVQSPTLLKPQIQSRPVELLLTQNQLLLSPSNLSTRPNTLFSPTISKTNSKMFQTQQSNIEQPYSAKNINLIQKIREDFKLDPPSNSNQDSVQKQKNNEKRSSYLKKENTFSQKILMNFAQKQHQQTPNNYQQQFLFKNESSNNNIYQKPLNGNPFQTPKAQLQQTKSFLNFKTEYDTQKLQNDISNLSSNNKLNSLTTKNPGSMFKAEDRFQSYQNKNNGVQQQYSNFEQRIQSIGQPQSQFKILKLQLNDQFNESHQKRFSYDNNNHFDNDRNGMVRRLSFSNMNDPNILPSNNIDQNEQNFQILENKCDYQMSPPLNKNSRYDFEDKNSESQIKIDQDQSIVMCSNSKSRSNSFIRGSPKRFLMKSNDQTHDSNNQLSFSGNKIIQFKASAKKLALSSFKESSIGMDEGQQDDTDKSLLEHRDDVKSYIKDMKNRCRNMNDEFDKRHSQLFVKRDETQQLQSSSQNSEKFNPVTNSDNDSSMRQNYKTQYQMSKHNQGQNDHKTTIFSMDNTMNSNTMQLYDSIYEKKLQETKYTNWRSNKNIETFNINEQNVTSRSSQQAIISLKVVEDNYNSTRRKDQIQNLNDTNTDSKLSEYQSIQIEQEMNPEDKRSSIVRQKLQEIQDQLVFTQNALRSSNSKILLNSTDSIQSNTYEQTDQNRGSNQYKRDSLNKNKNDKIEGIDELRNSIDLKLKSIMNKKQAYVRSDDVENQDQCEISQTQDKSVNQDDLEQSPEFSVHITPMKDEQVSMNQNDQTLNLNDSHERSLSRNKFINKISQIRQKLHNKEESQSQERLLNIQDQSMISQKDLERRRSSLQRSQKLLQNFQSLSKQGPEQEYDLNDKIKNQKQVIQLSQSSNNLLLDKHAQSIIKHNRNDTSDFMSRTYAMDINESFGDNKFYSQGYVYKISSKRQSVISENQDKSLDSVTEDSNQKNQNVIYEPQSVMNQIRQSIQKSLQETRYRQNTDYDVDDEYQAEFYDQKHDKQRAAEQDQTLKQNRLIQLNDEIEYTRISSKQIIEKERQKMKILNEEFDRQQKLLKQMNESENTNESQCELDETSMSKDQ
ncbi:UNKNOWN [Stylonychia lemnae]|uniref:Uncharacterized protein n=1 Tax=Stylonychia lemnae TaxID=5949 RepID=A0A078ABH5_STYLE|nr:UNKNOWN [Stylonychia lemnae]|eukprot:CDW79539.1 UNKNOWN [Stylonychia lemnae]